MTEKERASDKMYGRGQVLKNLINKIKTDPELLEANRQALINYHDNLFIKRQSVSTIQKSLSEAYYLLVHINKPIDEITKEDIDEWWTAQTKHDKPTYTVNTLEKKFTQIKKLLRIHAGMKKGTYPDNISSLAFGFEKKVLELKRDEWL
ncbi:MAG: hypothetical protein V1672_05220, partial [Candidatus Diapherotrites archaeon]